MDIVANKYHAKKKGKNDSGMEYEFKKYLEKNNLKFEEQVTFNLQEKFEKNGKKYLPIAYKTDFKIAKTLIDVKGVVTADFAIKKKLFEYKYSDYELKCVRTVPKWVKISFEVAWIELDEEKKLKTIIRNFKKENGYEKMNISYVTAELIEKINKKVKFFDILEVIK